MANINCPVHDDSKPSMTIYGEFAYCHVCRVSISVKELNLAENFHSPKPEPTNIQNMVKYIESLPKKLIRGLMLPYDVNGFFILWPGKNYYKKRVNSDKTRYVGPAGHKAPLLIFPGGASTLIVVEGELNAASLAKTLDSDYMIVSPGSASEFMRHIAKFQIARKVILFLDYDSAGICHGSQVKETLLKSGVSCKLVLLPKDFNQILQDEGELGVQKVFEENL